MVGLMSRGALMMWSAVAVACALLLAGCVKTKFTPHETAQSPLPQVTREAVLAQEGDLEYLAAAGGYVVGTMRTSGAPLASMSSVRGKTRRDSAKHGATHVIVADEQLIRVKLSNDRATTTCYGNTCQTEFHEGVTGNQKYGTYVLIRVSPENWGRLPEALRPEPTPDVADVVAASLEESNDIALDATVAGSAAPPKELTTIEIASHTKPSLVAVVTPDGLGSGFVVSNKGLVVTNLHVVAGAAQVHVQDPAGRLHDVAAVSFFDDVNDLAVLSAPTLHLDALTIDGREPVAGERIVVLGHPEGMRATVSEGIVSAIREFPGGRTRVQLTAPISLGSSGGPVVDRYGRVIGITVGYWNAGQSINFAIPTGPLVARIKQGLNRPLPMPLFATITKPVEQPEVPTHAAGKTQEGPEFPTSVIGFTMGGTLADAANTCSERRGQSVTTWLATGGNKAECPFEPVDLPFATPPVRLSYSGNRLTAVSFGATSQDDAKAYIGGKYGNPALIQSFHNGKWTPAETWSAGQPGGMVWSLRGGVVGVGSLDGKQVFVFYKSSEAFATEEANY